MTTELEQEFFKCFGIKPDCTYLFLIDGNGENKAARTMSFSSKADLKRFVCEYGGKGKVIKATGSPHIYYPEITDRVLLKLICCVPKTVLNNCTTIKEIKEAVLKDLILCMRKYTAQELKHQIQQLFKEE